jgi:hypothetical protein
MIEFLLTKWHILIVALFLVTVSVAAGSVVQSYFIGEKTRVVLEGLADAVELFHLSGDESYVYDLGSDVGVSCDSATLSLGSLSTQLLVEVEPCEFQAGRVVLSRSGDEVSLGGV